MMIDGDRPESPPLAVLLGTRSRFLLKIWGRFNPSHPHALFLAVEQHKLRQLINAIKESSHEKGYAYLQPTSYHNIPSPLILNEYFLL